MKNKMLLTKILVPVAIVVVIGGIWIIKNNSAVDNTNNIPPTTNKQTYSSSTDNPDFALHVTGELDLQKLKSYGLPILIDFGADTCIPCKEMAPVLKELNEAMRGKVIVKFVDVWKYQNLAEGYPVSVIPTQVLFDKDGKPFKPKNPETMKMEMYSMKDTGIHVFTAHQGGMTKAQILAAFKEMGVE